VRQLRRILGAGLSASIAGLWLAACAGACACGDSGPGYNEWPPDVKPRPDAGPDAGPDAWVEPVVAVIEPVEVGHTEPCEDATHLVFGPDDSYTTGQQVIVDELVTYGVADSGEPSDVFLHDLQTCVEYLVSPQNERPDTTPSIWNNRIVYGAIIPPEEYVVSGAQLMELDLETMELRQLSPWAQGLRPRQNDRYLLFRRYEIDRGIYDLVLHDRWTDQQTVLADGTQGAESHRINEDYAVWIAWGGAGKSVFYAELATGDVVEVPDTRDHAVYDTDLSGDIVLWTDLRTGLGAIHGLRISTGEPLQLTDDGDVHSRPVIDGHIAAWRTRPPGSSDGYRIEAYDLETGVRRVVVSEPSMDWKPADLDGEWLIYLEETSGYWYNIIHAVNLRRLGVLGPDGHLVPLGSPRSLR